MDKERLPQWGWLLLGLFAMALLSQVLNVLVLGPAGLPPEYFVVTLIVGMSLVVIYVSVWYEDDRADYWDQSGASYFGDVFFVVLATIIAAAFAIAVTLEAGLGQLFRELIGMIAGFATAWGMFYWRNTGLYRTDDDSR
ncbi:hypothetical protein HALLA_18255 [Halostagnicola larsenii XH-48]|uniref:Uncharacterized protein n=1 Tax=Halostagnicola larsenii XH-48 TaxID=797299 RepID=W0JT88_9EURY|nr:hypothetical protein [Halostagnicola larsenii]AHG00450.1 hypothetical protein HALLA_18255 [Halostagnicola larsenii XH-48]